MRRLLRKLYEPVAPFLIVACAVTSADVLAEPTGASTAADTRDLCGFCDYHGFGHGWARHTLSLGDTGHVLRDERGRVVAAGWSATRDFCVFEIGYTFRPAPLGAYFHGDFVSPGARGRGLQKRLLALRLDAAARQGKRVAHAILWSGNGASLASCRRAGFEVVATLSGVRVGPFQRDRLTRAVGGPPAGRLFFDGDRALEDCRWRRRHTPRREVVPGAART